MVAPKRYVCVLIPGTVSVVYLENEFVQIYLSYASWDELTIDDPGWP